MYNNSITSAVLRYSVHTTSITALFMCDSSIMKKKMFPQFSKFFSNFFPNVFQNFFQIFFKFFPNFFSEFLFLLKKSSKHSKIFTCKVNYRKVRNQAWNNIKSVMNFLIKNCSLINHKKSQELVFL